MVQVNKSYKMHQFGMAICIHSHCDIRVTVFDITYALYNHLEMTLTSDISHFIANAQQNPCNAARGLISQFQNGKTFLILWCSLHLEIKWRIRINDAKPAPNFISTQIMLQVQHLWHTKSHLGTPPSAVKHPTLWSMRYYTHYTNTFWTTLAVIETRQTVFLLLNILFT